MKVKELREFLKEKDPDLHVLISSNSVILHQITDLKLITKQVLVEIGEAQTIQYIRIDI